LGVQARVLPMSDDPVRTRIMADGCWYALQEFLIRLQAPGKIEAIEFRGARAANPTAEVLRAVESARAIIIGPSNPAISIGPILALSGLRAALQDSSAPVVAVSPLVGGQVVKGPTEAFMQWAGQPMSSPGVASLYAGVIDGLVADEATDLVPVLETDVAMNGPAGRARVAEATLRFALGLSAARSG
jgi:LPPG:FO 2-phospho-L-lactate transferase